MKARATQPKPKETTWMIQTAHKPEDIDNEPDFFATVAQHITAFAYQDIQVISRFNEAGVSVRNYIVLSEKPLVVIPRGPWERCEIPKAAPTVPTEGRTEREVFVQEPCETTWGGPHGGWRVKGVKSGTIYAAKIASEDKDLAIAIATGAKPYKIEKTEEAKAA